MQLSTNQRIALVQLISMKAQPNKMYDLLHKNTKYMTIAEIFSNMGLLTIDYDQQTVSLDLELCYTTAKEAGLVDANKELTELGSKLAKETVVEQFGILARLMKSSSSL